ncbi:CBS domain-containing protein [Pseudohaliea sp.]|uniref:CBS domain-containing protein n=1 Tax=Pseudohaliea sp. TaxID=2740289 RepID=UPI0032EF774B
MNIKHYRELDTLPLGEAIQVRRPEPGELLNLNSRALDLLVDFSRNQPPMLESATSVDDAEAMMRREHSGLKLVIGADETFRGIVTQIDIRSSKLMRIANATNIPRSDLTVADVMIPRNELHAVSFSAFGKATIGAVLRTMQTLGEQYLLVTDDDNQCLRGIISARDITRRLHLPDIGDGPARSIAAIQAAMSA